MELHGFGLTLCRATHTCSTTSFKHVPALSPSASTLKSSKSLKISRVFMQRKRRSIWVNANIRDEEAGEEKVEEKEKDKEDGVLISMEESGKKTFVNHFWGGVLEETGQIEWPPFQRVLGTTALVLAVIVGSSAVLLTVNAVLAEISDKVFSGAGIQVIVYATINERDYLDWMAFVGGEYPKFWHQKILINTDRVDRLESRRFTLPEPSSMWIRF